MARYAEQILLHYLNELDKSDVEQFISLLKTYPVKMGYSKIPTTRLEMAEKAELAYLMTSYYRDEYSLEIAKSLLHQIHRRDLLDEFENSSLTYFKEYQNVLKRRMQEVEQKERSEEAAEEPRVKLYEYETGESLTRARIEEYNKKYTARMRERYRVMEDRNSRFGEYVCFNSRYTQLLMIRKHRDQEEREQEMTSFGEDHLRILDQRAVSSYSSFEDLLLPDREGYTPSTVVIQGPAGIGKTMAAHKIMLDWASGELFQGKFDFAFYINCRELDQLPRKPSVHNLILQGLPGIELPIPQILADTRRVLFVIDGVDELNLFGHRHLNPAWDEITMEQVLVDIVEKNFCSLSTVILTTRPRALAKLTECLCNPRYAEILGFSGEARKIYFDNFFENADRATQALNIVQENEALYTMCFVPLFCWGVCTSIKQQMQRKMDLLLAPRPATSTFMSLVSMLVREDTGCPPQAMLKRMCALAKDGTHHHKVDITESDLPEYGLAVADNLSMFLNNDLFVKYTERYEFFTFTHVSVRDILAALFYVSTEEEATRENVEQRRQDVSSLLQAYGASRGTRYMLLVRFLFGLFQKDRVNLIKRILKWTVSSDVKSILLQWITEELKQVSGEINSYQLGLLQCLYEIEEEQFVKKALASPKHMHIGRELGRPMSALDFRILLFCLSKSPEVEELSIYSYQMRSEDTKALTSSLLKCSRVKLISCGLTDSSYEVLALVLQRSTSLKELDLSSTPLSAPGMKELCNGLKHPSCKLKTLILNETKLTDAIAKDICSAIKVNRSLQSLSLEGNLFSEQSLASIKNNLETCKSQRALEISRGELPGASKDAGNSTRKGYMSWIFSRH